jgi:acetate kinase
MKILVLNAGSSSLKYQLIEMDTETVLAKGVCERIGIGGHLVHKTASGFKLDVDIKFATHLDAFRTIIKKLTSDEGKVIDDIGEVRAVGHRFAHGGETFISSIRITGAIIKKLEQVTELAPLHNPACLAGIKACIQTLDDKIPQVAVFDTAFHQTMPETAFIYPIPYEYYERDKIRKYGFHGISNRYVSQKAAELINKPLQELKMVTCHLGNGSSITAINKGKSIDTSMGYTPLPGIIMGTRSGDIDPSIISYISNKYSMSHEQFTDILNKKSGLLGVSGVSNDVRDIVQASKDGNSRAKLALAIQDYQIKKYIGAYAAAMGGLDAVVFTGGIGENNPGLRFNVCSDMEFLGISIDDQKNQLPAGIDRIISDDTSRVKILVVATNEEIMIARDTVNILANSLTGA